jgi:hypothetical protein
LLSESRSPVPKVRMGVQESFVELVQEKVENPIEFSGSLKTALQNRSMNSVKAMASHLYVKHFQFLLVFVRTLLLYMLYILPHMFLRNTIKFISGLLPSIYTTEIM